jgi:Arc/MetJ-type ribon-helix-helix transcriptional regulator
VVASAENHVRAKTADSEKVTINLGFVDLGQIDLLVRDGFYANRTDFIRTAIRNQLGRHEQAVQSAILRKKLDLGLHRYGRADLQAVRERGEILEIQVLGLVTIADDVTPELALQTIGSIRVLGALHAPADVRAALGPRIQ